MVHQLQSSHAPSNRYDVRGHGAQHSHRVAVAPHPGVIRAYDVLRLAPGQAARVPPRGSGPSSGRRVLQLSKRHLDSLYRGTATYNR